MLPLTENYILYEPQGQTKGHAERKTEIRTRRNYTIEKKSDTSAA